MTTPLLEVVDLSVEFITARGAVRAVEGVSFSLAAGGTLALVGESGCGKSVTALSLMRLLPPSARVVSGQVRLGGQNLLDLPEEPMRQLRGRRLAMVFQEPMTALNPVFTVGDQVAEVVRIHERTSAAGAWARAVEMLRTVGIPAPEERARSYPHQLSGGMRQRVMIAMALVCGPDLLIADEPTTALDVTVQAQILELLARLQKERGMAVLLITHDLGVVAETCQDVVVMYAGQVVEQAQVGTLLSRPRHPYTAGLLRSVPSFGGAAAAGGGGEGSARRRLPEIPGTVPAPGSLPPGCRFQDRCERVVDDCRAAAVALEEADGRRWRCLHPHQETL
jgi:peptide/nickel transport system ATP-binding protein